MKKVINGKAYDSETAKEIVAWRSGDNKRDFSCCFETLYRTKNGQFFLYGEGHGNTEWGADFESGRTRGWGEDIKLLNKEETLSWMEKRSINPDCMAEYVAIEEG